MCNCKPYSMCKTCSQWIESSKYVRTPNNREATMSNVIKFPKAYVKSTGSKFEYDLDTNLHFDNVKCLPNGYYTLERIIGEDEKPEYSYGLCHVMTGNLFNDFTLWLWANHNLLPHQTFGKEKELTNAFLAEVNDTACGF